MVELNPPAHVVLVDELEGSRKVIVRHQESQPGVTQDLLDGQSPPLFVGVEFHHLGDVAQFALVDLQAVGDGAAHLVLGAR